MKPALAHHIRVVLAAPLTAYMVALFTVFISLGLREILQPELGSEAPLLVFLLAVIVSTWFGGVGPGVFAAVLGGLVGTYFFVKPRYTFEIHNIVDQLRLTLYLVEGLAFSFSLGLVKKAKHSAVEANQSKTQFFSSLTHELRTPLGAISGFADLLQEGTLTPEQHAQSMAALQRNCRFLSKLVDGFLDMSKAEAGLLELEIRETCLGELLDATRDMFSLTAATKGVEFSVNEKSALPPYVLIDSLRTRQIMNNIVGNALKFTASGFVRVSAGFRKRDGAGLGRLEIYVEDSGTGMSEQHMDRLFKPFFQGDAATFRHFGGTGLGLYLSRQFARMMGGDVELVRSERGRGTTFLITLNATVCAPPPSQVALMSAPTHRQFLQ